MQRFKLMLAIAMLLALAVSANAQAVYSFQTVNFPGDTFTQLLGVNNDGVIAGYHNFNLNQGFTLILSESYSTENFPDSMQTQVIGINNHGVSDGFYIDTNGVTHGFIDNNGTFITDQGLISGFYIDADNFTHGFLAGAGGSFTTLDFPRDTSTMALGLNNENRVVGTYTDQNGNVHGFIYNTAKKSFQQVNDPNGVNSTIINGTNDLDEIVGFYGPSNATIGFVGHLIRDAR